MRPVAGGAFERVDAGLSPLDAAPGHERQHSRSGGEGDGTGDGEPAPGGIEPVDQPLDAHALGQVGGQRFEHRRAEQGEHHGPQHAPCQRRHHSQQAARSAHGCADGKPDDHRERRAAVERQQVGQDRAPVHQRFAQVEVGDEHRQQRQSPADERAAGGPADDFVGAGAVERHALAPELVPDTAARRQRQHHQREIAEAEDALDDRPAVELDRHVGQRDEDLPDGADGSHAGDATPVLRERRARRRVIAEAVGGAASARPSLGRRLRRGLRGRRRP